MKICPKCEVPLVEGMVLDNSRNAYERGINGHIQKSNGKLIECFKCSLCGYSEIEETQQCSKLPPIAEWSEENRKSFEEFCEWGRRNCK